MPNPHERDWRESSLRMRTVAALYIDPLGVYPRLSPCGRYDRKAPGHVCAISSAVDCWDKARNAKLYTGPHPVVAHPDCGPWSKLRHLCTLQDDACGPRAFEQVREFGGVLEHPEHSRVFGAPSCFTHQSGFTWELSEVSHWMPMVDDPAPPEGEKLND